MGSHGPTWKPCSDSTMRGKYFLLFVCQVVLSAGDDDYELSRDPYAYQVKVEDDKTSNRYEINESGSPEIVEGSYRIALPDGRGQVMTYQVHADKGFEAKVSYEGTAQYPDSPNYVPSAYGPPEPIRPGYAKFKRQSQQRSARKKIGRKVEKEKKQKKITFKAKQTVDDSSDLLTASIQNNYFKNKEVKKVEKRQNKVKEVKSDDNDDTADSPQAEPLSLQQQSISVTTKRPQEYKPPAVAKKTNYELTKKNKEISVEYSNLEVAATPLVIHEAVPTSTDAPRVLHINFVAGQDDKHFTSPREAFDDLTDTVFSETIHNQAIRNLETSEPENIVSTAHFSGSYHSALTDHEPVPVTPPVATPKEFTNKAGSEQVDLYNELKDNPNADNKHSSPKTIPTIDPEVPKYPRIIFHDVTQDAKNHKKRKIDNNEYFKTDQQIIQKSENVLPIVYRSQIKWKPVHTENIKQPNIVIHKKSENDVEKLVQSNDVVFPNIDINIKEQKVEKLINIHADNTHAVKKSSAENSTNNHPKTIRTYDSPKIRNVGNPKVVVKSLPNLSNRELYQTIFEVTPPVTTRRPKYKIIRKTRVPKHLNAGPSIYQPVHRGQSIRLVQRNDGFVPAYVPRY